MYPVYYCVSRKMFIKLFFVVIFASSAISRHVPRYEDLNEDDQMLFRAAYDSPTYGHEEYHEEEELPIGKLDLLKDGMWILKAKIKQMKTFNKALAANLLATKLQIKELMASQFKTLKKHHHFEIEKKPVYSYQSPPSPPPAYSYYEPPHYTAPVAAAPQYGSPQHAAPQYEPPQYGAPKYEPPKYEPPQHGAYQYEPPKYGAPNYESPQHGAPQHETHQYGTPQYEHSHDPYYGH